MEFSRVGLVADFEDGSGQQLSTFRCGLGGCIEEIQQLPHRPEFCQHQFHGIGGPLPRSAQSGPAQPLGESLSRAFGGSFQFSQFFGSQSRGCGLGAEAGLRLSSERQTGLGIGLNAVNTHWETALSPMPCPTSLTSSSEIAGSQQGLALQCVYVIDDGHRFVATNIIRSILQSPSGDQFC
jgi:hypothetical protein